MSSMPGGFPADEGVTLSAIPSVSYDSNTSPTASAYRTLDSVNKRKFSTRYAFNHKTQDQRHLVQSLETIVYVLIGYQYIKFCYSAALVPVVLHVIAQKLISVESYIYGRPNTTLVQGVISLINQTMNTGTSESTRRSSRRSSTRSSPEPGSNAAGSSSRGSRRAHNHSHHHNHTHNHNHTHTHSSSRGLGGGRRRLSRNTEQQSTATEPYGNSSSLLRPLYEQPSASDKERHIANVVSKICVFLYWKFIIVSVYHVLFVSLWLMPYAIDDNMRQFQYGTWWFVSFIGETPPTGISKDMSWAQRSCKLGLPGLLFTNVLILFIQLILFQCIYNQSTVSPLGRKLDEDDDNMLRLPGEVPSGLDEEASAAAAAAGYGEAAEEGFEPPTTVLQVKLYEVFQWQSFTPI